LLVSETADVDLVLTMTREHRRSVLQRDPRALRRVFTLAEAAALLPLADRTGLDLLPWDQRAGELAVRLDAARARRAGGSEDDIRDPIGQPLEVHREVAVTIAGEMRPLADVLLAPLSAPALPRRPSPVA
jgi:protein-tyrosine phosphatase